jgi:non-ribosomal peptide synthetase component F
MSVTARFPRSALDASIGDVFDRVSCRFPERVAVSTGAHGITYATLNLMANGVAHALGASTRPGPQPVALLVSTAEVVHAQWAAYAVLNLHPGQLLLSRGSR